MADEKDKKDEQKDKVDEKDKKDKADEKSKPDEKGKTDEPVETGANQTEQAGEETSQTDGSSARDRYSEKEAQRILAWFGNDKDISIEDMGPDVTIGHLRDFQLDFQDAAGQPGFFGDAKGPDQRKKVVDEWIDHWLEERGYDFGKKPTEWIKDWGMENTGGFSGDLDRTLASVPVVGHLLSSACSGINHGWRAVTDGYEGITDVGGAIAETAGDVVDTAKGAVDAAKSGPLAFLGENGSTWLLAGAGIIGGSMLLGGGLKSGLGMGAVLAVGVALYKTGALDGLMDKLGGMFGGKGGTTQASASQASASEGSPEASDAEKTDIEPTDTAGEKSADMMMAASKNAAELSKPQEKVYDSKADTSYGNVGVSLGREEFGLA